MKAFQRPADAGIGKPREPACLIGSGGGEMCTQGLDQQDIAQPIDDDGFARNAAQRD